MNEKYIISVDYGCDLSMKECIKNNIIPIQLSYVIDDTLLKDNLDEKEYIKIYKKVRKGKKASIISTNVYVYLDFFYNLLKKNKNILHICEGNLESNNYKWANFAKEVLKEEYNDLNIVIINSNSLSLGAGMLALEASKKRSEDVSLEDVSTWILENARNVNSIFASHKAKNRVIENGLNKMLSKKTILKLKANGDLELANGTSFNDLYSFLKNGIINSDNSFKNQTLYISHSDNIKDAKVCGEKIKEELGFKNVYYSYMGPSVISNIGPNFLALFFFKDKCI